MHADTEIFLCAKLTHCSVRKTNAGGCLCNQFVGASHLDPEMTYLQNETGMHV